MDDERTGVWNRSDQLPALRGQLTLQRLRQEPAAEREPRRPEVEKQTSLDENIQVLCDIMDPRAGRAGYRPER
jgi:hypothetical protein